MISWGQSELIWAIVYFKVQMLYTQCNFCSTTNEFLKYGELFNPILRRVPLGLQFPHRITNDQIKMTCIKIDVAHSNRELTQKKIKNQQQNDAQSFRITLKGKSRKKEYQAQKTQAQSINDPVSFSQKKTTSKKNVSRRK